MRRIESKQQSSATPQNQDVGRGLQKIVAYSQLSLNPPRSAVFGMVSSLQPTSDFYTWFSHFFSHKYGSRFASYIIQPVACAIGRGGARAGGRTTAHAQYDVTIYDIGKRLFDCFGGFIFVRACEGFPA